MQEIFSTSKFEGSMDFYLDITMEMDTFIFSGSSFVINDKH